MQILREFADSPSMELVAFITGERGAASAVKRDLGYLIQALRGGFEGPCREKASALDFMAAVHEGTTLRLTSGEATDGSTWGFEVVGLRPLLTRLGETPLEHRGELIDIHSFSTKLRCFSFVRTYCVHGCGRVCRRGIFCLPASLNRRYLSLMRCTALLRNVMVETFIQEVVLAFMDRTFRASELSQYGIDELLHDARISKS